MRGLEFAHQLLELVVGTGICRKGFVLKGGEEVFPYEIELALEIAVVGGHDDDGVLFGEDDAELSGSAVASIGSVAALPELVAVALVPVWISLVVFDLFAGGFFDPFCWDELLAFPFAFLKKELAEFGDVFGF